MLLVVRAHVQFSWSSGPTRAGVVPALPDQVTTITDLGRVGVHLFLVISGFCIHLRWARAADPAQGLDFVPFWRRRLIRLYPPYLVAVLLSVAGHFVLFGLLGGATTIAGMFGYDTLDQLWSDLLVHALLFQNFTDASERIGNGVFWTLALEEQLYALYFLLLAVRRRFGWGPALTMVVTTTLVWRSLPLIAPMPAHWNDLGPARWVEWTLGALAVEMFFGHARLSRIWHSWITVAGLTALAVAINVESAVKAVPILSLATDLAFGLAFFAMVLALVRTERASTPATNRRYPLTFIGTFSYSIYLVHLPLINGAKHLLVRVGVEPSPLATGLVLGSSAVATLVGAYVFHVIFERPAILASRRSGRREAAPARRSA